MPDNYEVLIRGFGSYTRGSILPEWAVARAGKVEDLIAAGVVEKTVKAVNVDLKIPEPKAVVDPAPAMADELNRLRLENERLAADNRSLIAQRDSLQTNLAARDKALGEQTAEISRLAAKVEELTEELESATAPA